MWEKLRHAVAKVFCLEVPDKRRVWNGLVFPGTWLGKLDPEKVKQIERRHRKTWLRRDWRE